MIALRNGKNLRAGRGLVKKSARFLSLSTYGTKYDKLVFGDLPRLGGCETLYCTTYILHKSTFFLQVGTCNSNDIFKIKLNVNSLQVGTCNSTDIYLNLNCSLIICVSNNI